MTKRPYILPKAVCFEYSFFLCLHLPLSFHYDLTTKKTLTSKNKNVSANKQDTLLSHCAYIFFLYWFLKCESHPQRRPQLTCRCSDHLCLPKVHSTRTKSAAQSSVTARVSEPQNPDLWEETMGQQLHIRARSPEAHARVPSLRDLSSAALGPEAQLRPPRDGASESW